MAEKKKRSAPLYLLGIAFLSFVAIGMPGGLLNIAWIYIQETYSVSLDSLGVLLGASTLGHMITTFISGRMVGRFGIGPFLVAGGILGSLGMLGFVVAPSWFFLLTAAFLGALGAGVIDAGTNTFVSAHYSAGPLNWLHASFGLGATIGPVVVTFVVINLGLSWHLAYALPLVLFVVFTFLLLLTFSRWRIGSQDGESSAERPTAGMLETFKNPAVLILLLWFFVYAGLEVGAGQLTNSLFVEGRGIKQETSSFWISLYWLSFTIGRVLIGAVADRVDNVFLMRLSMVGALIGTLMLWSNLSNGFSFLGLMILGFALAPMFATVIAETPRRVGLYHVANSVGFQIGFAGLGIAFLPGLAGVLAQSSGVEIIAPFLVINAVAMLLIYEWVLRRDAHTVPVLSPGD